MCTCVLHFHGGRPAIQEGNQQYHDTVSSHINTIPTMKSSSLTPWKRLSFASMGLAESLVQCHLCRHGDVKPCLFKDLLLNKEITYHFHECEAEIFHILKHSYSFELLLIFSGTKFMGRNGGGPGKKDGKKTQDKNWCQIIPLVYSLYMRSACLLNIQLVLKRSFCTMLFVCTWIWWYFSANGARRKIRNNRCSGE